MGGINHPKTMWFIIAVPTLNIFSHTNTHSTTWKKKTINNSWEALQTEGISQKTLQLQNFQSFGMITPNIWKNKIHVPGKPPTRY